MRMSDWSSDVCSSDLQLVELVAVEFGHPRPPPHRIGHDKTTISDPMQSVRTLGSGPINCVVVTEAGKMAGQGASAGHSSAMAQSSNAVPALSRPALRVRSEEHTSELQSLMRNSYAVFCFNKKNQKPPVQ